VKMQTLPRSLALAAFLMALFCPARAATVAPLSLVDRSYSLLESNGISVISFFTTNGYKWVRPERAAETGYFFAKRNTNTWNVAATKADGTLTTQLALSFDTQTNGIVTLTVAGSPRVTTEFRQGEGSFFTNLAPVALRTMNIQNEFSITGPSWYTIDFKTDGTFVIKPPGYGFGEFAYTPTTNAAHLVLTYTGDLAGDVDDLNLQFKGSSGSTNLSLHTGTQLVSGEVYPVNGTFTFTAAGP
jgi:hypothetical protein